MKKNPASASRRVLKNAEDRILSPDRPPYFYKYKYIDEDHPEYSSRIFTHNELYFCSVNKFNDPFDCRFQIKFCGSDYEKSKFVNESLKAQAPHLKRQERRSKARKASKRLNDPDIANAMRDLARQYMEKWGLCCLSEVRDNILMWAHYANAHRGFCLEFSNELCFVPNVHRIDIGGMVPFPVIPIPVAYSEEYPVANPVSNDTATDIFLTKAKQWEYEKEWRMALPGATGSYKFPSHCLTGIIFGCRMLEKHKEMIREWCRNRKPTIKYYEARESEDSYSLNIVEIS